ncbi:hypothetical protein CC80DRAFT_541141 [Byssothecium circinans]|uniref:Wax synthase domain-containing protein n=1 Tax=Byssothecium circinans TaxID=147558 RepID=A0A6A5T7Q0_9PLEO|nr:hypothetical protein CC80DRAFT_541141 [Byssothecium circinans]
MSFKTIGAESFYSLNLLGWHGQHILRFLNTSFHPLFYFTVQVVIISFAIGFVPPRSNRRLLLLPLVVFCSYAIINSASEHLRLFWVCPLSGFANGVVLQYLDLGLLSHWGFDTKSAIILAQKQNGETLAHNRISTVIQRFYFGFLSTFSFRKVNTPYEVKNTPQFRDKRAPSKPRFLLQHVTMVLICILAVDVSSQLPPAPNPAELFAAQRVHFLSRLGEVSGEEIAVRIMGSVLYWCNLFAILQGLFSFAALLAVSFGLSDVRSWRPLFGSLRDATSLRYFWGKFWHQSLRDALYKPGSFLTHKVLHLPPGILARYTKLFLAFLISGLMHAFAEVATGLALHHGGSL